MNKNELKKYLIQIELCVDNEYLDKYIELIDTNKFTTKQPGRDRHHIVPRYYYRHKNITLNNNDANLVYLSRADHILAHIYLMQCSTEEYYVYSNSYAINNFVRINHSQGIKYDLEIFVQLHKDEIDEAARMFSELQRKKYKGKPRILTEEGRKRVLEASKRPKNLNKTGLIYNGAYRFVPNDQVDEYIKAGAILGRWPVSEESKEKNRRAHLGKKLPHTKEWNKKIGKRNKGKKLSEETKKKISDSLKGDTEKCGHTRGKICINDGNIIKYVDEQDFIANYAPIGWTRGNVYSKSRRGSNKSKIRINNETGARYVTLEEFETRYRYEGWHRGYDWKKKRN